MAWDGLEIGYKIASARVVAMLDDGGAMVITGDVECIEGRTPIGYSENDARNPPRLEYVFRFVVGEDREPDATLSVEAQIVIDGTHRDGPLEIRGRGWIGYDELGNCGGWFEHPPAMLLDTMPTSDSTDGHMSPEEWARTIGQREPKTTPEFERAARGRSIVSE